MEKIDVKPITVAEVLEYFSKNNKFEENARKVHKVLGVEVPFILEWNAKELVKINTSILKNEQFLTSYIKLPKCSDDGVEHFRFYIRTEDESSYMEPVKATMFMEWNERCGWLYKSTDIEELFSIIKDVVASVGDIKHFDLLDKIKLNYPFRRNKGYKRIL